MAVVGFQILKEFGPKARILARCSIQDRVSVTPRNSAAFLTGISRMSIRAKASNSLLNPPALPSHGGRTLQVWWQRSHRPRGSRQVIWQRYCMTWR
jgi:hypothetical protein